MQPVPLTFLLFLYLSPVHALQNVTIDSTSSSINYQGPWKLQQYPAIDYGGSQQYIDTQDSVNSGAGASAAASATASLTFTGTAVYYWAPFWPFTNAVLITLDHETPAAVKLVDTSHGLVSPGSVGPSLPSDIRWSRTGLSDTEHTITISVPPQNRFAVVDAITYTTSDIVTIEPSAMTSLAVSGASSLATGSSSSTATSHSMASAAIANGSGSGGRSSPTHMSPDDPQSSSSSSPGRTDSSNNHSRSMVLIAVASAMGALLGLVMIAILLFLLCRRRRRRRERKDGNALSPFRDDSTQIPPPAEKAGCDPRSSPPPVPPISSTNEKITPAENTQPSTFTSSHDLPPDPLGISYPLNVPRRSILSDHGSIADTAAPPPYQARQSTVLAFPMA